MNLHCWVKVTDDYVSDNCTALISMLVENSLLAQ